MILLVLLFAITLILLIINYLCAHRDFSNPGVILCGVILFAELLCLFFAKEYSVSIHWNTVWTITVGLLVFTVISILFLAAQPKKTVQSEHLSYIHLSGYVTVFIVLSQLLFIILFIRYINNIAYAYQGYSEGLMANISLFDTLNKFDAVTFRSLNVNPGIIYKVTRIISLTLPYPCLYVLVNNYFAVRKISVLQGVSVLLLCVSIVLTGSRSPLFRIVTMALILIYFFKLRNSAMRKDNLKMILKGLVLIAVLAVGFLLILQVMGRSGSNASHEIFKYIGAPLRNFDTYLQNGTVEMKTRYFGENTFNNFYMYLYDKGFIQVRPTTRSTVLPFLSTSLGQGLGNVYTMFYFFVIDFGYIGIPFCMIGIAVYYMYAYVRIIGKQTFRRQYSLQLFFFAYLINDLIMAFFSNRFYETILDPFFYKFIIVNVLFSIVFINSKVKIKKVFSWYGKKKNCQIQRS